MYTWVRRPPGGVLNPHFFRLLNFFSYWLCAQDDIEPFQMQQEPKESVAMAPRTSMPK